MTYLSKTFFIIFMSFTLFLNAQVAKEGMTNKKNNYNTITEKVAQNLQFWKKYNDERYYHHPEFGILPIKAPKGNVVEDFSKRTANDRYFIDLDNPSIFYVQKGYFPINYQDNKGDWRAIESNLIFVEKNIYESKYYFEPAGFDLNNNKSYIKTKSGKVDFNQWSLYKKVGEKLEFLAAPNWTDYTVGDDGIYITNIFKGIDAEMKIGKGSIETDFIMKSNEFGIYDQLIFREHYKSDGPLTITFSSDKESKFGVGNLDIEKDGSSVLTMYEGVGFLASDIQERTTLAYAIMDQSVDVMVPFTWIDAHIHNSFLVIDPVVTGTETTLEVSLIGSMYNTSCTFTNSCNYFMDVTFPPYATIINTTTDFNYKTVGACLFNDGATRYLSGNCVSPALPTYYWFCNTTNQGTCTGTNIPIYDDVKACFPAPSCTSQDIPFELQLYRRCKGASGCANDCISSASDWSVTITGKTVEFSNAQNSIALSETNICLGATVVASTLGAFGVPPYTYNWSFSPSGAPVIGNSNPENIVFPNPGLNKLYVTVIDACNQIVSDSIEVMVEDTLVPSFPDLGPYCMGEQVSLPTTSDNGITGTWSPALSTNTLGTKTYTFSAGGCYPLVVREITVLKSPYAQVVADLEACEGDEILPVVTFMGENTYSPYTFVYVMNGDTLHLTTSGNENSATITIPTNSSGVFNIELIQVLDSMCSKDLNQAVTVTIHDKPIADFDASSYIGESGIDITFQNTSSGENSVEWFHYKDSLSNWGNQDNFSQVFILNGEHQITLIAKNDHCESSITKIITILPNKATYKLPNVFTPNGDGVNDVLDFHFNNVKELDLIILNRWGNVVFQTDDASESWNGKKRNDGEECNDGVYYYKFSVTGLYEDKNEEHGFVHLVRD